MPIYEYSCKSCDHRFEELVFSDADEAELACPACDSGKLERLISGFAFKSSGSPLKGGSGSRAGKSCGPCSKSSCSSCG